MKYFLYGLLGWGILAIGFAVNELFFRLTETYLLEWIPLLLIIVGATFGMGYGLNFLINTGKEQ